MNRYYLHVADDYGSNPQTVTMLPGQTEACVFITVVQDILFNELNEEFCVTVTSSYQVGIFKPVECQINVTIITLQKMNCCFDLLFFL